MYYDSTIQLCENKATSKVYITKGFIYKGPSDYLTSWRNDSYNCWTFDVSAVYHGSSQKGHQTAGNASSVKISSSHRIKTPMTEYHQRE